MKTERRLTRDEMIKLTTKAWSADVDLWFGDFNVSEEGTNILVEDSKQANFLHKEGFEEER